MRAGRKAPIHGCTACGSRDNAWQKEDAMRITLSIVAVFSLLVWAPGSGVAKEKAAKVEAEPPPAAEPPNECGCYRDAQGQCHCTKGKKLKCECEGDCEPAGCEEQRRKKQEQDAAAALKRIEQNDKKGQAAAKAAQAKKQKEKAAEEAKKKAEGGEGRWK
jgi:hypothetical protein